MEEMDVIPRRTAAAGLGLLGALVLGLVGTIVFRIIHAAPRPVRPTAESTWASAAPAEPLPTMPTDSSQPIDDSQAADAPLPPATPIPTIAADSGGVDGIPAASMSEAVSAPVQEQRPAVERPRFLAPAGQ